MNLIQFSIRPLFGSLRFILGTYVWRSTLFLSFFDFSKRSFCRRQFPLPKCSAISNGRFVYVSNRGHFGISPCGEYLLAANRKSNSIVVFRIDSASGQLEATGLKVQAPTPVCVQFLPMAKAE